MLSTSCSIVREGEFKLLKMLASEPPDCILRQEIQLKHAQIYIYSEAEVQSAKHGTCFCTHATTKPQL